MLRIPNATVLDYEHVSVTILKYCCTWFFLPEIVGNSFTRSNRIPVSKLIPFPGLKEDVYVPFFIQDKSSLKDIGIDYNRIIITVRPPATVAHYHHHAGEIICHELLQRFSQMTSVFCVLIRRANDITFDQYLSRTNIISLKRPVNGLELIAASDMVFSGGGTMAREAAAMCVPSFSFFSGTPATIDRFLEKAGLLTVTRSKNEIWAICFEKRKSEQIASNKLSTIGFFADKLIQLASAQKQAP